jgi:hypothetical protein
VTFCTDYIDNLWQNGVEETLMHSPRAKMAAVASLALFLVLGSALALIVFSEGIRLTVNNRSDAEIRTVTVSYDRGVAQFNDLPVGATHTEKLGKIGEGADFYIEWRDLSGQSYKGHFNVYFDGAYGLEEIRVELLPRGKALLFDGDRQCRPGP